MIYITGATGFIGARVARRLLERGEQVRCLVRSHARGSALERAGAELIEGDVADEAAHDRGLAGAHGAIHLAAVYAIGIVDSAAMERTNVEGTRAFLSATERAGTPRVVYISTTAALGPVADVPTEPVEAYTGPYHSQYHRTKAAAHELARAAQRRGQPVIIVCPAFVYGPQDEGPAGRFVDDLLRRKVPALLSKPAWFSYVHVDDIASGIIAALDHGMVGEVYVLSGDPATLNDFASRVTAAAGFKPPRLRLPVAVARAASLLLDPIARVTGLRFPLSTEEVRIAGSARWLHTHSRAKRDLGYTPRTLAAGIPDTVAWALKKG